MSDLGQFLTRPIAHRGLHGNKVPENSWGALRAAVAEGHPIEFDLQMTGDGRMIVFHDRNLRRMTGKVMSVTTHSLERIQAHNLRGTDEPAPSFEEVLAYVGGRVPLLVEVKPAKIRRLERAQRVAKELETYGGPVAIQSFDPCIVQWLLQETHYPTGLIVGKYRDPSATVIFSKALEKRWLQEAGLTLNKVPPSFIAHDVTRLTDQVSRKIRDELAVPLLTWTVNSEEKETRAKLLADNYIFEKIQPSKR